MKSHSSTKVTAGTSRCVRVTCSTIARRMPLTGTRRPSCRGRGSRRRGANVVLHDPPARTAPAETDQLDAELPGQLPDGRRRAHRRLRVGRDDRDDRLARGLRLLPAVDGAQELLARLADHDDHGSDAGDVSLLDEDLEHRPGARRGDLDRRLVGLHLDERLILVHLVALGDEPAGDLGLGEALAEVGEPELVRHGGRVVQKATTRRTASTTFSTDGMYQSSSCQYGYGTS